MYATISADIVSSTSLSEQALIDLNESIRKCLSNLGNRYEGFWGRLVKGDSIECVTDRPQNALRIALEIKSMIKSFVPKGGANSRFIQYGVRIAIAFGNLRIVNRELDIIDGDAIYLSGRAIADKTSHKETFIVCGDCCPNFCEIQIMVSLMDSLINKAKPRQCEALYYRLSGLSQNEISKRMKVSPPSVSQSLKAVGWDDIERVLNYFESITF